MLIYWRFIGSILEIYVEVVLQILIIIFKTLNIYNIVDCFREKILIIVLDYDCCQLCVADLYCVSLTV